MGVCVIEVHGIVLNIPDRMSSVELFQRVVYAVPLVRIGITSSSTRAITSARSITGKPGLKLSWGLGQDVPIGCEVIVGGPVDGLFASAWLESVVLFGAAEVFGVYKVNLLPYVGPCVRVSPGWLYDATRICGTVCRWRLVYLNASPGRLANVRVTVACSSCIVDSQFRKWGLQWDCARISNVLRSPFRVIGIQVKSLGLQNTLIHGVC